MSDFSLTFPRVFISRALSDVVASVSISNVSGNSVLSERNVSRHGNSVNTCPQPGAGFSPRMLSQDLQLTSCSEQAPLWPPGSPLACTLHVPSPAPSLERVDRQTLAELLILPDTEERTSCKVSLLLLLLKRTEHKVALQTIWQN